MMSKTDFRLDYEGAINDPENTKLDFRKAMTIIILALLSSGVLSTVLFLLYFFLS